MSKHTPGPWRVVEREVLEDGSVYPRHLIGGERDLQIVSLESMFVAEKISEAPNSFWKHSEQSEANSRLIAAAPEMYAEILAILKSKHGKDGLFDGLRAIVDKVEG
jgi:hypothetical protein